ncbi:MAG: TRAP transporter small permease subunit [Moraxellaceae bacterium]|nr:TRAP transporter small permease subunit [Moraxellaceae bacterium]
MRATLERSLKALHLLEDGLLVGLLTVMIGIAVTQIVLRNGFDSGLLWGDSFLRVLVLWIGLSGALLATRDQRHISIDLLGRYLPASAARVVAVVNALFAAGISAALAWYTVEFVALEYESGSHAFAQVPTWVCAGVMPVAFSLIALRYLVIAALAPWRKLPTAIPGAAA